MNPVASLFINGNWIAGEGTAMESLNPGNGDQIWKGRAATNSQVDDAVQAAINAFPAWSGHTFEQRVAHVRRFNEVVEHYRTLIADTIGQETGKPFWEAETEVAALLGKAEISIQAYLDRTPSHEDSQAGLTTRLQHRPHGVVAIFGPYNFPAHLPNGHIMPALLAGNTIVLKPSELTPRTAELLVHLWQKAELPDGVLNLVQGDRETGAALASHPQIDGLYFTGSATTGCYLHEQFAGQTGEDPGAGDGRQQSTAGHRSEGYPGGGVSYHPIRLHYLRAALHLRPPPDRTEGPCWRPFYRRVTQSGGPDSGRGIQPATGAIYGGDDQQYGCG